MLFYFCYRVLLVTDSWFIEVGLLVYRFDVIVLWGDGGDVDVEVLGYFDCYVVFDWFVID